MILKMLGKNQEAKSKTGKHYDENSQDQSINNDSFILWMFDKMGSIAK